MALGLALMAGPLRSQAVERPPAAVAPVPATAGAGAECRLATPQGVLRVLRPADHDPRRAGLVVYVHGYGTTLDRTWVEDDLPGQFGAAGRDALFVGVSGPSTRDDPVAFPDLDALLESVAVGCALTLPRGPWVLIGHSAAYRTFLSWLGHGRPRRIVMLDALYGRINVAPFQRWVQAATSRRPRQLVLLAAETVAESRLLARRVRGARSRARLPEDAREFTPAERRASVLVVRSQYGHDEIVQGRKAIPVLLGLGPSRPIRPASRAPAPAAPQQARAVTPRRD